GEVSVDPAEETVKAARKTAAKPAEAKAETSASAAPAPAEPRETKIVHELTPAQIDELRLVLTDLAAARRLLVPDQAK
ncbi:MAG: hypothetical protein AAFW74_10000, partial [Pseudomonadota bacterium]